MKKVEKGVKVPSFGELDEEIEKQESSHIKKPITRINSKGRLHIQRPKGSLVKIKKAEPLKIIKKLKITNERVPTGIPGLDEIMEGGFRRNTSNLVGGGAGSGKSILGMQFLVNGIEKFDEPGILISFEETEEKIIADMDSFNWKLSDKINKGKLAIIYYDPSQVQKFLEEGGGTIEATIESIGAKRLVIDSLSAFSLLFDSELAQRKAMLDLFETLRRFNITTLVTSEQEPNPERHLSNVMEFEVDGVILLYYLRKLDFRERSIEVFKMRATKHSSKIFPMQITSQGVKVYPKETMF